MKNRKGDEMSLDVYLHDSKPKPRTGSGIFVRENGRTAEISMIEWNRRFPGRVPTTFKAESETTELYHANITHNLTRMAEEAGLYTALWHPERYGASKAESLIGLLNLGLDALKRNPEHYKKFNPSNGWGSYEGFVEFVTAYLEACEKYPGAEIDVSR